MLDLSAFIAALPERGALMGIDPGSKRIGIAVSDPARALATPIDTINRTRFAADAEAILKLFDSRACIAFVVGLPLNMDGSSGPSAQAARAFARNLLTVREAPLLMWDERLSTAAVTRDLIETDTSRARRAEIVDQMAASYVLQGVLDRLRA